MAKAHFQQAVKNLTIRSNVPGLKTGEGLNGWIEFWPNNYGPGNAKKVPGASNNLFDFGDEAQANLVNGYGCMQVHNLNAKQTVFAFNAWKSGGKQADLGIGNSPARASQKTRDWTFNRNAGSYSVKRLRVLVGRF